METDNIFDSPKFKSLQELEQRRAVIAEQLALGEFVTPQNELAYQDAHNRLGAQILEVSQSPDLQTEIAQEGDKNLRAIEELRPLEGVLQEEELSSLRSRYEEAVARVSRYFNSYGTVAPEAEVFMEKAASFATLTASTVEVELIVAAGQPAAIEPEAPRERAPKDVTVTVGQNVVRIGKSGITVKYSYKSEKRGDQRDYTENRRNALITMLALPEGKSITARELFAAAFPGEEFDGNKLAVVRQWFGKLTYRKDPVIKYTGHGKYYTDPKYNLQLQFGGKMQARIMDVEEQTITTEEVLPKTEKAPAALNLGDLFITANQLKKFNFVLEEAGIGAISEKITQGLEPHAPDLRRFNGHDLAIQEYRNKATERVIEFLNDREKLFEYIDSADEESAEYLFVDYLFSLDEAQQKLVKSLINARREDTKVVRGQVVSVSPQVYDEHGGLIYPFPAHRPVTPKNRPADLVRRQEQPDDDHNGGLTDLQEEPAGGQSVLTLEDAGKPTTKEPDAAICQSDEEEKEKGNGGIKLEQIEEFITNALEQIAKTGLKLDKNYKRRQVEGALRSQNISFRGTDVANARENNVGPRSKVGATFSIKDVLSILTYTNPQIQPHYRQYKKEIEAIISVQLQTLVEE